MAYIGELKGRKYKTGVISNVGHGFVEQVFVDYKTDDYFDAMILSSDVGVVKPDPMIYGLAAEKLGVLPQECVFIDDLEKNVKGAEDAAMKGILYKSVGKLREELEPLLTDADYQTSLGAH